MNRRLSTCLGLAFLFTFGLAWNFNERVQAQEPPKKPVTIKEEEDTPKPVKPMATKLPIKEEEEGKPATVNYSGPFNLTDEARKAEHATVKKFIQDFVLAEDLVTHKGKTLNVKPLAKKYDPNASGRLQVQVAAGNQSLNRDEITEVQHYELAALKRAGELLKSGLDQPGSNGKPTVSRAKLLHAVNVVLTEVHRWHTTAKARDLSEDWNVIRKKLEDEITQTRINTVRALASDNDWAGAEAMALWMYKAATPTRDLLDGVERLFVAEAQDAINKKQFSTARQHLERMEKNFPTIQTSNAVTQVQAQLQARAQELLSESQSLVASKQMSQALIKLEEALKTWPKLPGLREKRLEMLKSYAVLRVGVKHLPTQVSPTTAVTDVDKMAVRLVFDSLLKLRSGPSTRDGYVCKLSAEPRTTAQGWELLLPQDIKWSDGKPFTASDIARSAAIYGDPRSPYYEPLANEGGILKVRVDDPYRVTIAVERGHLDPLSLMTFDLLPEHLFPKDRPPANPTFGKSPIGTGPFVFKGVEDNEAVFVQNPHYHRFHAPDGAALKEIRLIQYTDVAQARDMLADGTLQVLLDLTSRELEQLEGIPGIDLLTPTMTKEANGFHLNNPRVYFLAPNYRGKLKDSDLRNAIALGINRDQILSEVYRSPKSPKVHKALNGVFPIGSWAFSTDYAADKVATYKPDQAKTHLAAATGRLKTIDKLSLLYPADDPQAAQACKLIRDQLAAINITVSPTGVTRQELLTKLNKDQPDFDLVYWCHDFENESLDIWPLFDPNGAGEKGRNFMGDIGDTELVTLLQSTQSRRDFATVMDTTQKAINFKLLDKMAVIPLWQLDRHIAVHRSLKAPRFHPLWVFDDVELWKLEARE